jgi:hypothetical protein
MKRIMCISVAAILCVGITGQVEAAAIYSQVTPDNR